MTLLEIALRNLARGWYVLPCKPGDKQPLTKHGFKDASNDEAVVREWWTRNPMANVGIAPGVSDVAVLDVDYGLKDEAAFEAWRIETGLPATYTVRTGRRPGFGVQMYYTGAIKDVGDFELNGCTGQVKSLGGYVMSAGCLHPSGALYEAIRDIPLAPTPDIVRALRTNKPKIVAGEMEKIPEGGGRHATLTSVAGKLRHSGLDEDALLAALIPINESMCAVPIPFEDLAHIAHSVGTLYDVPAPEPKILVGGKDPTVAAITDWRSHYHTFEQMENAPPTSFLIDGFLPMDAITALAAPVGQRKSLIAANVTHALCTKEPLFDHFTVTKQPTRILYLCPEMGIRSFADRLRKIGLMQYVGKTLFCRTMSAEGTLDLNELTAEELTGAVVIIDTAVRYLEGDENSSEDMRKFAESVFRLMRDGAASVLLLHHSAKGTKESSELSLENAMRGSGELGAFVSSCWATRLQNPEEPYQSASFITNVKQRDFESKPFEVTSGPDCRLHIVATPGSHVKLVSKNAGAVSNADGNEEIALQVIQDNPTLTQRALALKLKEMGIKRGKTWIGDKRYEVLHKGLKVSITR